MKNWFPNRRLGYAAVVAGCFALGMALAWPNLSPAAIGIDNFAYDAMFTRQAVPAWKPESVVVAIDERTLSQQGGTRAIRAILANALDKIAAANPKAVALDVTLHDPTLDDPAVDPRLAAAFARVPNLILPCELIGSGASIAWEDPLPMFARSAKALGHVYRQQSGADGVNRELPLEEIAGHQRRWALALEAYRIAHDRQIVDSPEDVEIGNLTIPAPRRARYGRTMFIRYLRSGIPEISAADLDARADELRGKTVFLGVTASGAHDRPIGPFGEIPGVEMNAQAYETIARGQFLTRARPFTVPLICALFAIAAGLIFAFRSGWQAYILGAALLIAAHMTPVEFFRRDVVFPYFAPVAVAWLSVAGAAIFQHLYMRRDLRRSESERSRYQQALHWAAHEMRTPLTAIQGSSEIMTRYSLPEVKQKQLSETINSESKRLARMIQTFLNVERLAEGQMEMKRERFEAAGLVATCLQRAAPIAEHKNIAFFLENEIKGCVNGDRELMEYAVYNLLTNAVKYSPSGTEIRVASELRGRDLRLSVRDRGIGMDAKELKQIFRKFYRTRRAEASGEAGTGIGLSIVEQIVSHHGGRIEVTSEPQKGSCFTIIVAASEFPDKERNSAAPLRHGETLDRRG
ncbi:MAG: CHASE2 domain-containing protein [Bryobacteraceae bacterium]